MNNVKDIANMYQQAKEEVDKLEQQLKEANELLQTVLDDSHDLFDIERFLNKQHNR